jgi:hypothetical protein
MRFNPGAPGLNHVTLELLTASFFDLKKQAAPGVDGVTWAEYSENYEAKIIDLHSRVHRGTYRAQPSKRTWIPKLDPSGLQHWRTRLSNGPFGRSWNASTKKTFLDSVAAIVLDEAVTEPWMHLA